MSGQSINDRITAARLSIAGQGLAKSVCKATTEEVIGPKKKHLDYLLHCTNEPNVSIPQMANCLIERTNNTNWVVVFKALITVHHLMCYGNERFTQYLASSNCNFQLGSFLDKTGVQGYDMSTFIRRYAKYLNEKAMAYRTVAFDFCKVKRGKDDGILRTMNAEKLLKTLPSLQSQLDALLEFDCTANELTNGVINTAFMLLFRDLIRLFACYNDGIINLLEKYFDMNKKMCRDALDIYKKFLIRMDRVAEFLKVAENVGIDKGDIPDLTKAPSSLLDALEQHLATLEGKKGAPGGGATTPTQATAGRQSSVKNGVLALSNTSNAFGTAAASSSGPRHSGVNGSAPEEDHLKKLALEEEQAILELHKERRIKELATQSPFSEQEGTGVIGSSTNPFLTSTTSSGVDNLFGSPPDSGDHGFAPVGKASDDLLCLANNPFSDVLPNTGTTQQPTSIGSFWGDRNGLISPTSTSTGTFVPEASFTAVFGSQTSSSQALGAARPATAATTEGDSGMEKGSCDLAIHGLNPFATISSATPSPSVPFEFGGPGTTPILGAPEPQGFGFGDFSSVLSTGVDEHESSGDKLATSSTVSQIESSAEAKFAFAGDSLTTEPLMVASRPISPSPGSQAPKPSPASSPAPPLHAMDAFGEFSFKQPAHGELPPYLFDVGGAAASPAVQSFSPLSMGAKASPLATGPASPAHVSQVASGSAVDDLNAAIRAALSSTPSVSSGTGISSVSPKIPSDVTAIGSMASSNVKQVFGFGSPSKRSSDFDAFGDILQPVSSVPLSSAAVSQTSTQSKVITGDLDSSLASLAQNLSINRPAGTLHKSGNMWNSPKNTAKTGGANWTPQITSSTATSWNSPQHSYQPMGNTTGRPADWSGGMMAGHFPQAGGQGFPGGAHVAGIGIPPQQTTSIPGISPVIGMGGPSVMHSSLAGPTATKGFPVTGAPIAPLQVQPLVSQIPLQQTSTAAVTTTTTTNLDPFGSL